MDMCRPNPKVYRIDFAQVRLCVLERAGILVGIKEVKA